MDYEERSLSTERVCAPRGNRAVAEARYETEAKHNINRTSNGSSLQMIKL